MHGVVRALCVVWVTSLMFLYTAAQSLIGAPPSGTGSIGGKITCDGKPIAGLRVGLEPTRYNGPTPNQKSHIRTQTDTEGRYRFTGVTAGQYLFITFSTNCVQTGDPRLTNLGRQITVNDGEDAADIDIALVRGGIITGKVTDLDSRPLIEQVVRLDRIDAQNRSIVPPPFVGSQIQTDDRGVYRTVALAPGRYRVYAGGYRSNNNRQFPRTYHPDAREAGKASIIEVREGEEISGVDIRLNPSIRKTYSISGRALDAVTGEPVKNIAITYTAITEQGMMLTSRLTGPTGDFSFENLEKGRYGLLAGSSLGNAIATPGYSDLMTIEVEDEDVSGLEIQVKRGGSIAGTTVLEGAADPAALSLLTRQRITASESYEFLGKSSWLSHRLKLGPDGRFRLDGLRPGIVNLYHQPEFEGLGMRLMRVERDGVELTNGIELGPGQQVSGIRIVFAYGTGVIRGRVSTAGGALPESAQILVHARWRDHAGHEKINITVRPDERGYFIIEGLISGRYDVVASVDFRSPSPPKGFSGPIEVTQAVQVADGQTVQVSMTVDLNRGMPNRNR